MSGFRAFPMELATMWHETSIAQPFVEQIWPLITCNLHKLVVLPINSQSSQCFMISAISITQCSVIHRSPAPFLSFISFPFAVAHCRAYRWITCVGHEWGNAVCIFNGNSIGQLLNRRRWWTMEWYCTLHRLRVFIRILGCMVCLFANISLTNNWLWVSCSLDTVLQVSMPAYIKWNSIHSRYSDMFTTG